MLDLVFSRQRSLTINNFHQRAQIQWLSWYLAIVCLAGLLALLMYRGSSRVNWLAWLFLAISIIFTLFRPRYGIYLSVFWTLAGDQSMMLWYPFIKNFSSRETLLYLSDNIIFSPLELLLIITLVSWLIHDTMHRQWRLYRGVLFWPVILFAGFITFGLVYGIGSGGNINIGLWESRAIFYMLLMVILVSNLFEKRDHIKTIILVMTAALLVKSLYGIYVFLFVLRGSLGNVESLTDHQAAVHLATVIILFAASLLYRVAWRNRILLLITIPPILLIFLAAQRRSGFIALLLGLGLLAIMLFVERRTVFWMIVPPTAVLGLAYLGIFWGSSSPIAGPAQAVKSVIAEDQADYHDRLSNEYRKIENFNSTFTIKQKPLTGVGFGNKFYIVIPMPDISSFTWWEYMPHNSVVYIWIKAGFGGFLSLLLLVGLSITQGMRATKRITDPFLKAIALTATIYIIMHFVYAYVDISWEAQGMLMLGVMIGILNSIEPIIASDQTTPQRRWPWQSEWQEAVPLLPLQSN